MDALEVQKLKQVERSRAKAPHPIKPKKVHFTSDQGLIGGVTPEATTLQAKGDVLAAPLEVPIIAPDVRALSSTIGASISTPSSKLKLRVLRGRHPYHPVHQHS